MAGHSHWKQIKAHKGVADKKRSRLFSKLLNAVAVAAKRGKSPQFNARLRAAAQAARDAGVPSENIDRAISRTTEKGGGLFEFVIEAYDASGAALLVVGVTDNTNRTIQEVKIILKNNGAKFAEPGSVRWAFKELEGGGWRPKFEHTLTSNALPALKKLIEDLETQQDVHEIYHNAVVSPV